MPKIIRPNPSQSGEHKEPMSSRGLQQADHDDDDDDDDDSLPVPQWSGEAIIASL